MSQSWRPSTIVTSGQHSVGVDAHDKVDDLVRCDGTKPMRSVWRNDDDVTGPNLTACSFQNRAAKGAGSIEDLNGIVVGGYGFAVFQCAFSYQSGVA